MAEEYLDNSQGYTDKIEKWTTKTPVHADEMNKRLSPLVSNIEAVRKSEQKHENDAPIHTPIYFGDTEPDSDTYLWFAPVDSVIDDEKEIILSAVDYTGDESKLHVETEEGKLYTVENSSVTQENGETVVTFE